MSKVNTIPFRFVSLQINIGNVTMLKWYGFKVDERKKGVSFLRNVRNQDETLLICQIN